MSDSSKIAFSDLIDAKKDGQQDGDDDKEHQRALHEQNKKQIDALKNDLDALLKKKAAKEMDLKKAVLELGSKKDQLRNAEVHNFFNNRLA